MIATMIRINTNLIQSQSLSMKIDTDISRALIDQMIKTEINTRKRKRKRTEIVIEKGS